MSAPTFSDRASEYALAGLPVFPLKPGGKVPATKHGLKDASQLLEDVWRWGRANPDYNIGIAIPSGMVVIDVDTQHDGHLTLEAMLREHGPLPPTWEAKTGNGGRHYWFTTTIEKFTAQVDLGDGSSTGIDVRAGGKHYVVTPPSVHPNGTVYEWIRPPFDGPAATLPEWLARLIVPKPRTTPQPAASASLIAERDSPADQFCAEHTWTDVLAPHGWTCLDADGDADGARWRHSEATADHSATVRHGCLFVYSPNTPFEVTSATDPHGYTKFKAYAALEFGGDMSAAARQLGGYAPIGVPDVSVYESGSGECDQTAIQGRSWQPVDLGPYLRGEIERPTPTIGLRRSDGQQVIYPGREHVVIGETESGKTWFVLACAAAEMAEGHTVLYVHYEEGDPGSTIERLRLLGIRDDVIAAKLIFVGPAEQVRPDWLATLLEARPRVAVHDGVNEAMALHGAEITAAEGASEFRRRLITPCLRAGAATIACDHLPKAHDGRSRDAFGSVHKGNAIDGARFVLENAKPFGRGLCGVSNVFVTKDRPGHLRARGAATKTPGKTYMGTLVVDDDSTVGPDPRVGFYGPKAEGGEGGDVHCPNADVIRELIATQPTGRVESFRQIRALLRLAGHSMGDRVINDGLDHLVATGDLTETAGPRGAKAYQLTDSTVFEEV